MLAQIPPWIHDAGALAAAILAVFALMTAGLRSRPGRWVVRKIREDMAHARREEMTALLEQSLQPVMAEMQPNGGSSWRDEVRRDFEAIRDCIAELVTRMDTGDRDRTELWRMVEKQFDVDMAQPGRGEIT